MKKIAILSFIMVSMTSWSQQNEKDAVQSAIEVFFKGFHAQDTLALQESVSDIVVLQRISKDSVGNTVVSSVPFNSFVQGIASIPKTTSFKEIIKSFSIQVDGAMANAWTPYEFWLNGEFHHCGVNSFQLIKYGERWKIVYLIDTSRKDCE